MKVAVIGTGYVGLVAGACFADMGNSVICADIDQHKIEVLKRCECPIYEPGLPEVISRVVAAKKLFFTTDVPQVIRESDVVFIAVGTPHEEGGVPDLRYVKAVAETIGKSMNGEKVIVNKSTVPVGGGDLVRNIIAQHYPGKFHVVSNPEFLREGTAILDFMKPDRVVIGCEDTFAQEKMHALYAPLNAPILFTGIKTAELIKYASNAFLATKVSFINEVANLCDAVGANVTQVADGVGMDQRIGRSFLNAGCGWGGSCFPKDVLGLISIGKQHGVSLTIAQAAYASNQLQKELLVKKLKSKLPNLYGKKIAVLGLAFKPETDDMRDATSLVVMAQLKKEGAKISAYDPVAAENANKIFSDAEYADSIEDAVRGADAILLVTEWAAFKELDFAGLKRKMHNPLLVDGRNLYNPHKVRAAGFTYIGMGVD